MLPKINIVFMVTYTGEHFQLMIAWCPTTPYFVVPASKLYNLAFQLGSGHIMSVRGVVRILILQ